MRRKLPPEELEKLVRLYEKEDNGDLRAKLLHRLSFRGIARLNADTLIADADSEDEKLRIVALNILAKTRDERVRSYALERLCAGDTEPEAIGMLIKNRVPDDSEFISGLVKAVPITCDDGGWHGVFSSVLDAFRERKGTPLPQELLRYMYENTLCGSCRFWIVAEMSRRHMLTEELLREIIHDSYSDTSDYAKKRLK